MMENHAVVSDRVSRRMALLYLLIIDMLNPEMHIRVFADRLHLCLLQHCGGDNPSCLLLAVAVIFATCASRLMSSSVITASTLPQVQTWSPLGIRSSSITATPAVVTISQGRRRRR